MDWTTVPCDLPRSEDVRNMTDCASAYVIELSTVSESTLCRSVKGSMAPGSHILDKPFYAEQNGLLIGDSVPN